MRTSPRSQTIGTAPSIRSLFDYAARSLISIWREMSAVVDCGMTPNQVISAATKTNAEILGVFAERGSMEPGKQADVLAVAGNLLEDI